MDHYNEFSSRQKLNW